MTTSPRRKAPSPATTKSAPAEAQPIIFRFKRAAGEWENREARWPADWKLPIAGDAIRLAPNLSGIVHAVEYDLPSGRIVIHLR